MKTVAKSSCLLWYGIDIKGRGGVKNDLAIVIMMELGTDVGGDRGVGTFGESISFRGPRRVVCIGSRSVWSCNGHDRTWSRTLVVVIVG